MTSKIRISIDPEPSRVGDYIRCTIYFDDPNMIGSKAEYIVETKVSVDMKSGSDKQIIHILKKFKIKSPEINFDISANQLNIPDYIGNKINIITQVHVLVDDALFSKDSKKTKTITRQGVKKAVIPEVKEPLINYNDKKNFIKSVRALVDKKRKSIMKIIIINSIIILGLLFTLLYSGLKWMNDSSNDNNGVIFIITIIITVIGVIFSSIAMYVFVQDHLKTWLKVTTNKKQLPNYFPKDSNCKVSELIKGKTSMDVDKLCIRIVACNMENGVYHSTTKSSNEGTRTEAVCFNSPVREFILFEKVIHNIKKGVNISKYLDDIIYFKNIYKFLYPKNMVSKEYGINHYWEIQIMHDDFIDYYVSLPSDKFDNNDFYNY